MIEYEHVKLIHLTLNRLAYSRVAPFIAAEMGRNKSLVQINRYWNQPLPISSCMELAVQGDHVHTLTLLRRWVNPYDRGKFMMNLREFYYDAVSLKKTKVMKLVSRWLERETTAYKIDYMQALRIAARNGSHKVLRQVVPSFFLKSLQKQLAIILPQ